MVKTFGATDKRPRKHRSDIGKKRKKYAGKPTKKRRRKKFDKRIGKKTHIYIWIWEIRSMTKDGYRRWKTQLRPSLWKETPIPLKNAIHKVDVKDIESKEKIERWMEEHYYGGKFWIKGFSHAKNKHGVTNKRLCEVCIQETPDGNRAKMTKSWRLHRYWFFKK